MEETLLLLVPLRCTYLHVIFVHILSLDSDPLHSFGWKKVQLEPRLQPDLPFPSFVNLGHILGCSNLQPFPDIPNLQLLYLVK